MSLHAISDLQKIFAFEQMIKRKKIYLKWISDPAARAIEEGQIEALKAVCAELRARSGDKQLAALIALDVRIADIKNSNGDIESLRKLGAEVVAFWDSIRLALAIYVEGVH